ncbi:MAG: penicillin-insensitive murein endopeptidase, partial [Myxococcales bacterium]|nr:penicillin-insensitive murein endopeptidase [Myxococcales bacterium]
MSHTQAVGSRARRGGWRGLRASLGLLALLASTVGATSGCATPGRWTDYTSVSVGKAAGGHIHRPVRLTPKGVGYKVPKTWRERGNQWGTEELVATIERAAARVQAQESRRRIFLGVADLSPKRGGKTMWHASHQSGRDVDLIFYAVDEHKKPLPPPEIEMVHFDGHGEPFVPKAMAATGYEEPTWAQRRFDDARNWARGQPLLTHRPITVQCISALNQLQLQHHASAERHERPRWLIESARQVMHQPGASAPPDDHFHVRLYSSRADRQLG